MSCGVRVCVRLVCAREGICARASVSLSFRGDGFEHERELDFEKARERGCVCCVHGGPVRDGMNFAWCVLECAHARHVVRARERVCAFGWCGVAFMV